MRQRWAIFGAVAVAAAVAAPVWAETTTARVSTLDGTMWSITVTPSDEDAAHGAKPFTDTMVFKDELVKMTTSAKRGFQPSLYTLVDAGGELSFTTQQAGHKQGVMMWVGKAVGETMDGIMVWTKDDGAQARYRFAGQRASKKASASHQ